MSEVGRHFDLQAGSSSSPSFKIYHVRPSGAEVQIEDSKSRYASFGTEGIADNDGRGRLPEFQGPSTILIRVEFHYPHLSYSGKFLFTRCKADRLRSVSHHDPSTSATAGTISSGSLRHWHTHSGRSCGKIYVIEEIAKASKV